MGLFRRKKMLDLPKNLQYYDENLKRWVQRGDMPKDGNLDRNERIATARQEDSGSISYMPTQAATNPTMPNKKEQDKGETKPFVKTSGNHFQDFRTLLAKSKDLMMQHRYEDVLECEDVILRLISEKGMNPSQRALSLHTKANCYWLLNRFTESKKCLLEVLEFDPYNEEALTDLHNTEMKIAVKERTEKNNTSSQEPESSFCENCGKSLRSTAKFCGKCGTPRA